MNSRETCAFLGGAIVGLAIGIIGYQNRRTIVASDSVEDIDVDRVFKQVREEENLSVVGRKVKQAERFTRKATDMATSKEAKEVIKSAKDLLDNLHGFAEVYEEYFGESAKRESMHRRDQNDRRQGPNHRNPRPKEPNKPIPRYAKNG